jgi:LacI family transcriptional regulator
MPIDVSDLCCVNSTCSNAGKRAAGNLRFVRWTGKNGDIRFVRCRTCKSEFSERKGTPLFHAHLPKDEIVSIIEHLMEGDSQRKTARLTHHDETTVARLQKLAGLHAKAFHDEKAQHLVVPEVQLDEKWAFVKKNKTI